MKAYWLRIQNFGDQLTAYWIERLTGVRAGWAPPAQAGLVGCGSILRDIPQDYAGIIIGTGMMYDWESASLPLADVRSVRGPLTGARISEPIPERGDWGLLFALERGEIMARTSRIYDIGVLPHYADTIQGPVIDCAARYRAHSRKWIDITAPVDSVVYEVSQCRRIVSSSLHGIILADALGIESMWIDSDTVCGNGFKFRDYAASLGEEIAPNEWRLGNQDRVLDIAEKVRAIVTQAVEEMERRNA